MTTDTRELKDQKCSARFDEETRQRLERISKAGGMTIADVIRILTNRGIARQNLRWMDYAREDAGLSWKLSMRIEPRRRDSLDVLATSNGIGRGALIRAMVEFELTQMQGDEL